MRALQRVIAIDFDGCLCQDAFPVVGSPNWEVIERARQEKADGAALILWTCREGKLLEDALRACEEWELQFDAVNANLPERIEAYGNDCRKISADEYWDDRAVAMPDRNGGEPLHDQPRQDQISQPI